MRGDVFSQEHGLETAGINSPATWWETVVHEFNATVHTNDCPERMEQAFEAQVCERPNAVSVVSTAETLTYAELNVRAEALATRLREASVGSGAIVAVCLDRSVDFIVTTLAVLKARAAYLPLDSRAHRERQGRLIRLARPTIIIAEPRLAADLGGFGPPVTTVGELRAGVSVDSALPGEASQVPLDTAYVIFTSGSTGEPKGVVVRHAGVLNFLAWVRDSFDLGPDDVVLSKAALAFDVSVLEMFLPLACGGRLVLAAAGRELESAHIVSLVQEHHVTFAQFVPSLLNGFLNAPGAAECRSLRGVMVGGEAISIAMLRRFFATLPGVALCNSYGPTEASIGVTGWWCTDLHEGAVVPIGRPIWNVAIYILDEELHPVPIGTPGEIFIAGSLAHGYLGDEELTAERFLPNPLPTGGDRLYRTGDRAAWNSRGEIEFLGRMDRQVKLAGARVELGEIEAAAESHPAVEQAVVTVRMVDGSATGLNCYLTLIGKVQLAEVRSHMAQCLPTYMMPNAYSTLSAVPTTPNGKVDYRALPELPPGAGLTAVEDSALTRMEHRVARAWQSVLRIDGVGPRRNFFDVGGHSLAAAELAVELGTRLGVDVSIQDVFEHPTIADQARVLQSRPRGRVWKIPRRPTADSVRPTVVQDRYLRQMVRDSVEVKYKWIPLVVWLDGELSDAAVSEALTVVGRRHEPLRSKLIAKQSPFQMIITPAGDYEHPLEVLRMEGLTDTEQTLAVADLVTTVFEHVEDVMDLSMYWSKLVHFSAVGHALIVVFNHMAFDAWSKNVFLSEFGQAYNAAMSGKAVSLPGHDVGYYDYAEWQYESILRGELNDQIPYWLEVLDEPIPPIRLSIANGIHDEPSNEAAYAFEAIDLGEATRLARVAQRFGVTLFALLLGIFELLISKYSGETDIAVRSTVAVRNKPQTKPLIGAFINTIVVRARIKENATVSGWLTDVNEAVGGAYAHSEIPIEVVSREVEAQGLQGGRPLLKCLSIQFWGTEVSSEGETGLNLEGLSSSVAVPQRSDGHATGYDLGFEVAESSEGISITARFKKHLFEPDAVQTLLTEYRGLLRWMTEDRAGLSISSVLNEWPPANGNIASSVEGPQMPR
jgi:amino acid adenylation domain-containing protein